MIYEVENEKGETVKVEADDIDEAYRILEQDQKVEWVNQHYEWNPPTWGEIFIVAFGVIAFIMAMIGWCGYDG